MFCKASLIRTNIVKDAQLSPLILSKKERLSPSTAGFKKLWSDAQANLKDQLKSRNLSKKRVVALLFKKPCSDGANDIV